MKLSSSTVTHGGTPLAGPVRDGSYLPCAVAPALASTRHGHRTALHRTAPHPCHPARAPPTRRSWAWTPPP